VTIAKGDRLPDLTPDESDALLQRWIGDALADDLAAADLEVETNLTLVSRLNLAISKLSRTAYFDMRDLTALLKDVRDEIEQLTTDRSKDDDG